MPPSCFDVPRRMFPPPASILNNGVYVFQSLSLLRETPRRDRWPLKGMLLGFGVQRNSWIRSKGGSDHDRRKICHLPHHSLPNPRRSSRWRGKLSGSLAQGLAAAGTCFACTAGRGSKSFSWWKNGDICRHYGNIRVDISAKKRWIGSAFPMISLEGDRRNDSGVKH